MKKLFVIIFITAATFSVLTSQDREVIETKFKVFGNCDQCKTRIETIMRIKEVKYAKWDKKSKILKTAFENSITVDSLQKRLAYVGHDTEKYKANDSIYAALPKCCLYRDNQRTH